MKRSVERNAAGEADLRDSLPLRQSIDFPLARQQVEQLREVPGSVRSRALATYVGLFELADDDGRIAMPHDDVAAYFEITRVSWNQYRDILEAAGLLQVGDLRGGALRRMQLVAPR